MPGRVLKAACLVVVVLAVCAGMAHGSRSAVLHAMKVDATGLMPTQFFIDGRHFEGTSVETIELAEGNYRLDPGSGLVMRCELTVTGAGSWDYASECDSFLAGRGSDTLRLVGFAVTIDASPLSTPIFFTGMRLEPFRGPRQLKLLPTINPYFAQPGAGVVTACHFNLALDGTFTYPDENAGCLSGRGTRTLTYNGVPVNIDARQLSTRTFSIAQAFGLEDQRTDVIQRYRLLPTFTTTNYGFWTPRGAAWPSLGLRVGLDGRIDYPASADRWVSGRGTDTLVIAGYPIEIDATATAPGSFEIPDAAGVGVLDRAVVHRLRLPPVSYIFGTRLQAEFNFSIREQDGTVELAPDAGPCVSGAGTTRLTVGCTAPPPPPPPPPPDPRPSIKTLRRVSVTPAPAAGRPVLVTAQVAGNATRIAWKVGVSGRESRIVAPAGQATLRVIPKTAGRLHVSAQPIGPAGAGQASAIDLAVGPGPQTSVTRQLLGGPKQLRGAPVVAAIDYGPNPEVSEILRRAPKCLATTIRAGALQVSGCLLPVTSVDQIPEAERGILREMTDRLRGAPTGSQLNTALEQLSGYLGGPGRPLDVNGLAVTPRDAASVVFYSELEAVASSDAAMAVGTDPRQQIRLGNPGRFLLDIGQRVRGEIPIGPLPRIGGLSRLGGFGFGSNRVSMRLVPGDPPSTLVTVRLRLPSWLSIGGLAAEGEATFRATPDHGLVLQDMRIGPIDVDLGAAAIKAFQIRYRSETGEWEGSGKACVISGCLEANVLIAGDELQRLWASMPLPPPGVTLFPFVQLNRVDFGGARTPTRFFGGAGITAYGIYDITARATLAFPGTNAPFSLDPTESPGFPRELYGVRRTGLTLAASGDAAIKVPIFDRVPFARGHFLYEYPGYFALGGELDQRFGPLKLDGRMAGAFNAGNGRFNVEGGVETCFTGFTDVVGVLGVSIDLNVCRGGNGVFSNRGAAGCAKIIWRFGVGYDFRTDTPSFWPFGCEWERYRELDVRGNTARAAAGRLPLVVRIDPGERPRALAFHGADGAPRLRVSGPGGERVDAGSTVVGARTIRVLRSEPWKNTTIALMRPGTYRIEALPGSPAVASIKQAFKSPPARVSASVSGRGVRRVLRYRIRDRADQRVTFMEVTSRGTARPIATVDDGGRGTLRFSPSPGTGRRVVAAQFEIDGWPAERRQVASFRPPSPRLDRPAGLRVRRRGTALHVSWRPVPGATGYEVVLTPAAGRQRTLRVRGAGTTIRGVAATVSGRVGVLAVATQREGRTAQARFQRTRRADTGFRPLPPAPRMRR